MKVVGWRNAWRIRKLLNLKPSSWEKMYRKFGYNGILNLYEDNLRTVLKTVSSMVEGLNGRIVVTSDHGEAFGEGNIWSHKKGYHIPVLVEVPWLKVK